MKTVAEWIQNDSETIEDMIGGIKNLSVKEQAELWGMAGRFSFFAIDKSEFRVEKLHAIMRGFIQPLVEELPIAPDTGEDEYDLSEDGGYRGR